jgi:hypothetical protein
MLLVEIDAKGFECCPIVRLEVYIGVLPPQCKAMSTEKVTAYGASAISAFFQPLDKLIKIRSGRSTAITLQGLRGTEMGRQCYGR